VRTLGVFDGVGQKIATSSMPRNSGHHPGRKGITEIVYAGSVPPKAVGADKVTAQLHLLSIPKNGDTRMFIPDNI